MSVGTWLGVAVAGAVTGSTVTYLASHFLRTENFLSFLNEPAPTGLQLQPTVERIGTLTQTSFSDLYAEREQAAGVMARLAVDPSALLDHFQCVEKAATSQNTADRLQCDITLEASVLPPVAAAPEKLEGSARAHELDIERLVANAERLSDSLVELRRSLAHTQPAGKEHAASRNFDATMLRAGLVSGLNASETYVKQHKTARDPSHPATALVLSGGAANGAFSAGFVSRLLEVMQAARATSEPSCGQARIDLTVGTSVGALIGVLVDLFFVNGQEEQAQTLLRKEFTCTVDSDLYCENDAWLWDLFVGNVKGIVKFDGLERMVSQTFSGPAPGTTNALRAMVDNPTELVTMSVDTNSGLVYADSDQEPLDPTNVEQRTQTILASLVEPGLANYVEVLKGGGRSPRKGAFVDGGVVTPLPAMQAVLRGAERAIIVSNWTHDLGPTTPAQKAGDVFFRSLAMQSTQLANSEVDAVGMVAAARRLVEYHLCVRRFAPDGDPIGSVKDFCERRFDAAAPQGGTFPWVASSWQSTWIHRAESEQAAAAGYSFKPDQMRPMFLEGAAEYQRRCEEVNRVLGLSRCGAALKACPSDPPEIEQLLKQFEQRLRPCSATLKARHCQ
jgi:predicted acylesterase/phospholipase RssA